jgi:hypothetical protein
MTGQTFSPAPDWSPEHQAHLKQFLASPAGLALMARGRAVLADTAVRACHDPFHTQHSAARAAGFSDGLKWLDSLSRSSRVPEEATPAGSQTQKQTDTSPLGEMELRESLSP